MQVLYQLKRHNALLRVTVFGVLPEQQHAHTVGNETYGFPLRLLCVTSPHACCAKVCGLVREALRRAGSGDKQPPHRRSRRTQRPGVASSATKSQSKPQSSYSNQQTQNMRLDTLSHRPARLQVIAHAIALLACVCVCVCVCVVILTRRGQVHYMGYGATNGAL